MLYQLLPTKWTNHQDIKHTASTVLHSYIIRWDDHEQAYRVVYTEHSTQESGYTFASSVEDAKDWAINTHLFDKMLQWFNEVKETAVEK